jgi:citrate synthase
VTDNRTGETRDIPIDRGGVAAAEFSKAVPGVWFYDPGFLYTAAAESAITFVDGDLGILRYRGYPIEQLAEHSTYLEVAYLLNYGDLPNEAQAAQWEEEVTHHTYIHENVRKRFLEGFNYDAHPMGMLVSAIAALSTYYKDAKILDDPEILNRQVVRLIAKMPTLAAAAHRFSVGMPFVYPDNTLDYTQNFLSMMWKVAEPRYEPDPVLAHALDVLFILHADHEQNCSTSTVRLVGSSQANLFTSISGGINALWGPLHGGANQAVLEMLEQIRASGSDVHDFVKKVKNREDNVKLMGFGHRVYKNYDPRARIVKEQADKILGKLGGDDELLSIAKALEEVALTDEFFIERKLYPNVDFYTGLIYRAMGFPTRMFTVLFALGRLPGWIAHWREMHDDPNAKIGRPRQVYTGYTERDYKAIDAR